MNERIYALIVVVLAVAMVTTGLICQFPHCNTVKCEVVDRENCQGTVKMGGGYCGCCEACFTEVGLGEVCEVDYRLYPPTFLCEKGLYCEYNTTTCEEIPGFNIG
ncbi:uncharacterized protein LOC132746333 [Ruditapes philippinarum]|uniref:uncharacterized protein LOC132746333 n=1 Tax=Ruditapes philippinarum TaxID=129788 RepID=UPI00295B7CD9|nr:uncharacterized protein LOC132746333 [Ruditapes philippinarum]